MSRFKDILCSKYTLRFALAIAAAVIMLVLVLLSSQSLLLNEPTQAAVIAAVLMFAALIPLITDGKLEFVPLTLAALATAALVFVRICMFYYQSGDYGSFLYGWVEQMRGMSLTEAMSADIGDYNMPYLYILFIISRLKVYDLFAIKAVSCVFDVVAAYFLMKIVAHFCDSTPAKITAYLLCLALPTVWLNGAYWGQCDVMFTAFCLGMVYFVLKKRGVGACVMWAVALSFKLQAIFALPVLIVALFSRRIRLRHTAIIPAVFFSSLVPAMVCTRGFYDCIKIYFEQANQYPRLHLNIPSIWVLAGHVEFSPFNSAATFLAGAAVVLVLLLCWHYRNNLTDKNLMLLFFATALLIPFLLPRMHDRYYFLADLASLAVFLVDRKKWYLPLVTVLSSYSGYHYFVMGGSTLFDVRYFAIAILVILTLTFKELFEALQKKDPFVL